MGFFSLKTVCSVCENECGLNRYQIKDKDWICSECLKKIKFNLTIPIQKLSAEDIKNIIEKKKACSVCGNECGEKGYQIKDEDYICSDCYKKAEFGFTSPIQTMSVDDVKNIIAEKKAYNDRLTSFNITKEVGIYLKIDENKKEWYIPDGFWGNAKKPKIHSYDDILDFELLEDGDSVIKGGLGRALVGGFLFGNVGAVVGGVTGKRKSKQTCNTLKIKITLNDMENPTEYINLIIAETKKEGLIYKSSIKDAQEIVSLLQIMCEQNKNTQNQSSSTPVNQETSPVEEIKKYKSLLDDGIITQEEFDAKKKQLLNL